MAQGKPRLQGGTWESLFMDGCNGVRALVEEVVQAVIRAEANSLESQACSGIAPH